MKSLISVINEGKSCYVAYVDSDSNDSEKRKYIGVYSSTKLVKDACERWEKKHHEDEGKTSWYEYEVNLDFFEF